MCVNSTTKDDVLSLATGVLPIGQRQSPAPGELHTRRNSVDHRDRGAIPVHQHFKLLWLRSIPPCTQTTRSHSHKKIMIRHSFLTLPLILNVIIKKLKLREAWEISILTAFLERDDVDQI